MSELSPKARALLEAARRDHGPSADDRDRVLMGLHASLGIAVALPTLADASTANAGTSGPQLVQPPAAAPVPDPSALLGQAANHTLGTGSLGWSKLFAWKAGKVWLASMVIGGSAVGIAALPARPAQTSEVLSARTSAALVAPSERNAETESADPVHEEVLPAEAAPEIAHEEVRAEVVPEEAALAAVPARAEVAPMVIAEREPAQVVAASSVRETRGVRSTETRAQSKLGRQTSRRLRREQARERELLAQKPVAEPVVQATVQPAAEEPVVPSIAAPPAPELALIRAALTSLRDRDSLQALRLLDEHAARYPNGAFATERRGLHAIAQCAAGRAEDGARERAAFLKSFGSSPIAARVRSACPR